MNKLRLFPLSRLFSTTQIKKMEPCKLYYFNVTGLAEPIRYLLHYCSVEFDDIRFKDFEEWTDKYQKDMPMEQVPVLEIGGVKYHQHVPICRYIANKYDLYGSNDEESTRIDALIADLNDMRLHIADYFKEEDLGFKEKLKERMLERVPFFLNKFESRIVENNGFFVGTKISLADIYYAGICEIMSSILGHDINDDYPNLNKLTSHVRNLDRIKAYIEKRPTTIL